MRLADSKTRIWILNASLTIVVICSLVVQYYPDGSVFAEAIVFICLLTTILLLGFKLFNKPKSLQKSADHFPAGDTAQAPRSDFLIAAPSLAEPPSDHPGRVARVVATREQDRDTNVPVNFRKLFSEQARAAEEYNLVQVLRYKRPMPSHQVEPPKDAKSLWERMILEQALQEAPKDASQKYPTTFGPNNNTVH